LVEQSQDTKYYVTEKTSFLTENKLKTAPDCPEKTFCDSPQICDGKSLFKRLIFSFIGAVKIKFYKEKED
jgi:hypothetical protein